MKLFNLLNFSQFIIFFFSCLHHQHGLCWSASTIIILLWQWLNTDPHMNLPSSTPERDCYGLCDLWPQQAISQFYCSHADNQGTHCPLLKKCSSPSQNETLSVGNHNNTSNNSTSGVNILNTISRTPTFSFSVLHIFCLLFAMLLRFPLALTEWHHLSKGLT